METITPEIEQFVADMIETMMDENGSAGFAAPQLGRSLRIFVFRDEKLEPFYSIGPPEVMINPKLTKPSKETETMLEGCMSVPGLRVSVERPKHVHVRYQNLKGEWIEEHVSDYRARKIMHENDHLNGVLHIDRTTKRERQQIEPLLLKIKAKYNPE